MKSLIIFLQAVIIMLLWLPLFLIGFFVGILQVGFMVGKEKGEDYFEYLDKKIKVTGENLESTN